MPTWLKILLVLFVIGIVIAGVLVYVGIRFARKTINEMEKDAPRIVEEAKQFGRGKDGQACVTEALRRANACDGFICEAKQQVFLGNCLSTATISPEFCKDVPKPLQMTESQKWAQAECARRGASNQERCMRVLSGVQSYCSSR